MSITYSFTVDSLDCLDNFNGLNKVVTRALWTLTGVDGDFSHEYKASTEFPAPGEEFTDFESLTPEIVIGWIEEHTPVDQMNGGRAHIADAIAEKKAQALGSAPIPVSPPLPWDVPEQSPEEGGEEPEGQ